MTPASFQVAGIKGAIRFRLTITNVAPMVATRFAKGSGRTVWQR